MEFAPVDRKRLVIPSLASFYDFVAPLSWPLIRCSAGLILAYHGWVKIMSGPATQYPLFEKFGYSPGWLVTWVLILIEFVGGLCISVGFMTRFWAAAAAIQMAELTFRVYLPNGYNWTKQGFEFTLLWGLVLFAIALRGGGPYSIDRKLSKEL